VYGPCTWSCRRPCTWPCMYLAPVHGGTGREHISVHGVYMAVYGHVHAVYKRRTRSCTRVHGLYTLHSRVHGLYGPCTRPLDGRVRGVNTCTQPCTRPYTVMYTAVEGRVHVYTTVYAAVYRPCIRLFTRTVSTAVYTALTRPCTGRVH